MKRYKKTVVITIAIVFALLGILGLGRLSFSIFKDNLESKIFPMKDHLLAKPVHLILTKMQ